MTLRSGSVAIGSLLATKQSGPTVMVAVSIDALPHTGGRYGPARECADRNINSGPNGLAGPTNVWITHHGGTHSISPVIHIDEVPTDGPMKINIVPEEDNVKRERRVGLLNNSLQVLKSKLRTPDKSAPQCD